MYFTVRLEFGCVGRAFQEPKHEDSAVYKPPKMKTEELWQVMNLEDEDEIGDFFLIFYNFFSLFCFKTQTITRTITTNTTITICYDKCY